MTNKETKYAEKLMKFIIGEEVKVKRTKGEKVKLKELGVGHLSSDKSQSVKLGEREYASGTISKIEKDSAWNVPPAEGRKGAWPLTPNPDKPKTESKKLGGELSNYEGYLQDALEMYKTGKYTAEFIAETVLPKYVEKIQPLYKKIN
jgi:hypothetical protein